MCVCNLCSIAVLSSNLIVIAHTSMIHRRVILSAAVIHSHLPCWRSAQLFPERDDPFNSSQVWQITCLCGNLRFLLHAHRLFAVSKSNTTRSLSHRSVLYWIQKRKRLSSSGGTNFGSRKAGAVHCWVLR